MRLPSLPRPFVAGLALAAFASSAFAATPPTPFTAKYQVLRQGDAIGEATIQLKVVGNGEYEYSNRIKGTSGLAAMLGASSSGTTRFRWHDDAPETVTYEYRMNMAVKQKQRHVKVDWAARQVTVAEGKDTLHYASAPGMVDRNTTPFALGLALRDGKQEVTLPVGVKQRVESQQYKVKGTEPVTVPAGSFSAERVERTDSDKHFDAWYVPKKYPLPVKLSQSDGGDLTLLLVSYQEP